MNTIHDTSIRRVLLSAHARDQRWAKVDRIIAGVVSAFLWPLAVCAVPVMLIEFSRKFNGRRV